MQHEKSNESIDIDRFSLDRRSDYTVVAQRNREIAKYLRRDYNCCRQIYVSKWFGRNKNILLVFDTIEGLASYQEGIFYIRYYPIFKDYQARCFLYALIFHMSRFIVTVGSITVPALLSLQNASDDHLKWIVWTISLAVTIFNGILTLFKIDKKYYFLHTTRSYLESEAWQYISLSGKYSKTHGDEENNSHAHQFPYFCAAIERIKMRQVEEEYYKAQESSNDSGAPHAQQPKTGMAPHNAIQASTNGINEYFGAKSSSSSASGQQEAKEWANNVAERTQEALRKEGRYY